MLNQAQAGKTVKVLMVCLGNICRSPTAHGVLIKLIENSGLEDMVEVDSAGTSTYHIGESPDRRSVAAAARRGYSLESFSARQVTDSDYHQFDYIMAMDQANLESLRNPILTAEAFGVEEIIDPRETRPLLVDWARRAYEIVEATTRGPKSRGMRP